MKLSEKNLEKPPKLLDKKEKIKLKSKRKIRGAS